MKDHSTAADNASPGSGVLTGSLSSYSPRPDHVDEMIGGDGSLRLHWQVFAKHLERAGMPELLRRWEEAKRIIRENGVTYNVYGDPRGMARPWQLDPVPSFLDAADFSLLEAGLKQRAELLDRILADLYGPQQLLREGLFPAELLFGNPGFLRPCHGLTLPHARHLHLYGANLGRGGDGRFFVLGDRTQSPSGAGYALENRIVLSRMLPIAFRDCRVQRLAGYFGTLKETMRSLAVTNRDNPRIVLLTPGPFNETYFEHAYLARYLGYTLVEGNDLTVRDNRVYLKLLGGLQQVDVILRRLDDDFCDPVELRADSFLGIPGLVQAVREGNVAVANSLGSGLIETPALLPLLPALCRRLLDTDLLLPSVRSWWCGNPESLQYVLDHLRELVVKATFGASRREPIFAGHLSQAEFEELKSQIRAQPREFVGQEIVPLSTSPVLVGDHLEPRQMVLRTYLVSGDSGYAVMPGGLTRVSASAETMIVSMQRGGGSKDTWVLADGPVSDFSLLRSSSASIPLSREGGDLSSRVADNLFWLGRYVERAESLSRMLRGVLLRLAEHPHPQDLPDCPVLLKAVREATLPRSAANHEEVEASWRDPLEALQALIFDPKRAGGLTPILVALLRVAGTVRDRLSTDMWRAINATATTTRTSVEPAPLSTCLETLNRTISNLAAFAGLAADSMTRGQGWRFLDMGRRLERCLQILTLLKNTLAHEIDDEGPLLEAILEIADSLMTYRRRYLETLQAPAVLDLLLADESNPRSVVFQLAALSEDVEHLPHDGDLPGRTQEQKLMMSVLTELRLAEPELLARVSKDGCRVELLHLVEKLSDELPKLSDSITQRYLSHLETSRHLGSDFRRAGD